MAFSNSSRKHFEKNRLFSLYFLYLLITIQQLNYRTRTKIAVLIQNSRGFWTRLFSKKIKKCLFSITAYLKKNVKDVKRICKKNWRHTTYWRQRYLKRLTLLVNCYFYLNHGRKRSLEEDVNSTFNNGFLDTSPTKRARKSFEPGMLIFVTMLI